MTQVRTSWGRFDRVRALARPGYYGVIMPVHAVLRGTEAATAGNYTTPFFIAERSYEVVEITERHEVPDSSGTPTLMVKKAPSGTATSSGTDLLDSGFDLTSTADTNVKGALTRTNSDRTIETGDALSLETTGSLTEIDGVTVSVLLRAI